MFPILLENMNFYATRHIKEFENALAVLGFSLNTYVNLKHTEVVIMLKKSKLPFRGVWIYLIS